MSKVNALYHIVFCTKSRKMTIPAAYAEDLYRFIWNMLRTKDCHRYRISGIENHIHMLINLNPKIALSSLIRDIKANQADGYVLTHVLWASTAGLRNISQPLLHIRIETV